jgi:putative sterol carrier protein
VTCAAPDFMNIVSGKMNPQMAFMSGKLKIKGDLGLAMKLQKVIG